MSSIPLRAGAVLGAEVRYRGVRFWVRVRFKKTQRVRVQVRVRSKNIFWVRVRVRARLDKRQGVRVRVRYKKGKLGAGAGAGAVHQKLHADVGCGRVQLSNSKLINLTFRTVIIILKDRAVQPCLET